MRILLSTAPDVLSEFV